VTAVGQTRVATYNLLHGVSLRDGSTDPAALAAAAATIDADVLGLQEVDRDQPRSGVVDQTAVVAAALGAEHWRFEPTVLGTPGVIGWRGAGDGDAAVGGVSYGVGLVSRLPVTRWAVLRFAAAPLALPLLVPGRPRPRLMRVPDEPRLALAAVLDHPAGPLTVITAHLSFVPGFNVAQLRQIARWSTQFPGPVLLIGDFNLPSALPARITRFSALARAATYPSYRPAVQFDHLLARGLASGAVTAEHVWPLPVSDHAAVGVDVDLADREPADAPPGPTA